MTRELDAEVAEKVTVTSVRRRVTADAKYACRGMCAECGHACSESSMWLVEGRSASWTHRFGYCDRHLPIDCRAALAAVKP